MQKSVVFDLEQSRKRLNYFNLREEKLGSSPSLTKWIQIYSERTRQLEARMKEQQLSQQASKNSDISKS
jgi:hypothetical protein